MSGIFSDKQLEQTVIGQGILRNIFGYLPDYQEAFPIYHVNPETPPQLLLNGDFDISLKRHTRDYYFILKNQGVYVKTRVFPGTDHLSIHKYWRCHNRNVLDEILLFLRKHI